MVRATTTAALLGLQRSFPPAAHVRSGSLLAGTLDTNHDVNSNNETRPQFRVLRRSRLLSGEQENMEKPPDQLSPTLS